MQEIMLKYVDLDLWFRIEDPFRISDPGKYIVQFRVEIRSGSTFKSGRTVAAS